MQVHETPLIKATLGHDTSKKPLSSGFAAALAGRLQVLWFCSAQIWEQDMTDHFSAVWNIYWSSNLCWYLQMDEATIGYYCCQIVLFLLGLRVLIKFLYQTCGF